MTAGRKARWEAVGGFSRQRVYTTAQAGLLLARLGEVGGRRLGGGRRDFAAKAARAARRGAELLKARRADGSWASEDGPDHDVDATFEALWALWVGGRPQGAARRAGRFYTSTPAWNPS